MVDGTTAALNLQNIDFASSPGELERAKERESSTRRKMQQCLYLRGLSTVFRAFISPQIASVGYHPRSIMDAGTGTKGTTTTTQFFIHEKLPKDVKTMKASAATRGKGQRRPIAPGSSPKKRLHRDNATKEEIAEITEAALTSEPLPASLVPHQSHQQQQETHLVPFQFSVDLPSMWQTYLRAFFRQQADTELSSLKLTKAHVKTLILDICLEFLKADHLQLENSCLWTIAPFACDYFIARYESPALVGCWLFSFVEGLLAFQDDQRIAFFCAASGLTTSGSSSPGYDVFLYYLHALGHIFFGQMKIFKAENRLEETAEGSCPVHVKHILATAETLFSFTVTSSEKKALVLEIDALAPVIRAESLGSPGKRDDEKDEEKLVELDDAMAVFLSKWSAMNQQVDEVCTHFSSL